LTIGLVCYRFWLDSGQKKKERTPPPLSKEKKTGSKSGWPMYFGRLGMLKQWKWYLASKRQRKVKDAFVEKVV